MSALTTLLYAAGAFAIVLGVLHFTFPERFGFFVALPAEGPALPPYRLLFYRYDMTRSDLRGIIYVMNHCVSYAIVAAGVFDCFAARWLGTFPGSLASGVVAGFWFVRAGTQFYLGRRPGDWLVVALFVALCALHVVAAFSEAVDVGAPNQTLETNCRPASPLDAGRHFERAVHAQSCVSGGSRSALRSTH